MEWVGTWEREKKKTEFSWRGERVDKGGGEHSLKGEKKWKQRRKSRRSFREIEEKESIFGYRRAKNG